MKKILAFFTLALVTACSGGQNNKGKPIEYAKNKIASADTEYDQFNLKKSHEILESALLIKNLQDEQKCEILRKLAFQDWKYYKDYNSAKKRLKKAISIDDSKFDTWMLNSRIERESRHFDRALDASLKAEKFADSENEINDARIAYTQAVYEFSVYNMEMGKPVDKNLLDEASKILSIVLETNLGMPKPSKLLLGIALLNNNGANALKAWLSYFQILDMQHASPYLLSSAEKLNQVCKTWHGNELNLTNQELLIDALTCSRFYEFIPVYVRESNNKSNYNQKIKDFITYSEYLKEVRETTNEYYRNIAIGKTDEANYIKWLNNEREKLWKTLSFTSHKLYNEQDFLDETEKHFGAGGFTGSTGNYKGYVLCLGHIVNQEKATIEQYGYKPEFTYTEIDMMTSNGYSSWFWEDKAIGGWATENEIIRVREAYLNDPFEAWKTVTDKIERPKTEKMIKDFLNNSDTNQMELSKGLSAKLRFDALNDLYNEFSLKGLSDQELKLAFLSGYKQYRIEASILSHEGRHSIERKYMPEEFKEWDSEKREFHAKLSQIEFAEEPRLELAGMITGASGDSGHARANQHIINIAVEWIKNNKKEITGYSENKSAFSQICLMTVKQILECYKQVDPLNE